MSKRYAVLDKNNLVVNHILISDPLPAKYWPGYGATLVPLEECDISAGAAIPVVKLKISDIPQIGDTLDIETGELTKFQPKIEQIQDEKGEVMFVASAPEQKFVKDAEPIIKRAEAVIIDRSEIEIKGGK